MKDIVKILLYDWLNRDLPEVKKRYFPLKDKLKSLPAKIIVITGFRRVGKTYLLYGLID